MACPVCKEKKTKFSIKVKDYEYNITDSARYSQCISCESIYRSFPNKIKKREKKFYPKKKYLPIKGSPIYDLLKNIYANYEKKQILGYIGRSFFKRKKTVLDIACGKGYLIRKFIEEDNADCFGIDINISTEKNDKVNFIKASYDNLKLIKKINPDLIIINNFLEHIENLENVNKIIRRMKKKSYLVIITLDGNSPSRKKFSNYWSGYHAPRHKIIFTPNGIKKFFSQNKKISFKQMKIYDPFTNLVSMYNFLKEFRYRLFFVEFFKIFNFLLYTLLNLTKKNRILMIGKKTY